MKNAERIAADLAALPLHSAVFASNINFFTRSCPCVFVPVFSGITVLRLPLKFIWS